MKHYIATASLYNSNSTTSYYNTFEDFVSIHLHIQGSPPANRIGSGVKNFNMDSSSIDYRQGMYCQIYSVIFFNTTANTDATIKLRNFVYRSSRPQGASTTTPIQPIGPLGPIF